MSTPPTSSRDTPRFRSREQKQQLAAAFQGQGADYDRLRPGYPEEVVDWIVDAAAHGQGTAHRHPVRAVDLGAGTGKLSCALAGKGIEVTAVDPSAAMLEVAKSTGERQIADDRAGGSDRVGGTGRAAAPAGIPRLATQVGTAEATGLPDGSAELVTVAQAWHWFDTEAACAEIRRILAPGGILALLWNNLDVQVPWVHRLSRIMHAGDVYRDDFTPPITDDLEITDRRVHHWEQMLPTQDLIDLARTRSYLITAAPAQRDKVLANLDWYVHEHLGHAPGTIVGLPYRTDLFLLRAS